VNKYSAQAGKQNALGSGYQPDLPLLE